MTITDFARTVLELKSNGSAVVTLSIAEAESLLATLILEVQ